MVASEGPPSDLSIDVRTTIDTEQITIRILGDVDLLTAPTIATHLGNAVDRRPATLVLDCLGVTFLDSSGLRALLQVQRSCEVAGIDLVLQPSDAILRVIRAVGIEAMLTPVRSPAGVRLPRLSA